MASFRCLIGCTRMYTVLYCIALWLMSLSCVSIRMCVYALLKGDVVPWS